MRRRRNPYSEAIYPALVAAADGPLRAWLQARAADVDRVIGEATDDLLLGTQTLGEQADRVRAKVEAAIRSHPGIAREGIADLALGLHGKSLIVVFSMLEGSEIPYRYSPFPFDFADYARKRWAEATQGRDVTGSVEQTQAALSRLGPYQIEIEKGYDTWRAVLTGGSTKPLSYIEKTRKKVIESILSSNDFGEKLADTQLRSAGFDVEDLARSIGVSRGGIRRRRQQEEAKTARARREAEESAEADKKNLETARDFLARTTELHAALAKAPEIKDLRGLKKSLPPGFEANRSELGTAKGYNVRFDRYFWRGDGAMSLDRAIKSLRWYVSHVAGLTPEEIVKERQSRYPSTNWHFPFIRASW